MRFYQGLLPAIQWDKETNSPKVEFVKGVFDTDDEELINFLFDKGYLVEEDVEELMAGGRLDHGGFEPQKPVVLPSGRPPMDNPEMAHGGTPHHRAPLGDTLPESEQAELTGARIQQEQPEVKKRPRTASRTTSKKTTAKKTSTSKTILPPPLKPSSGLPTMSTVILARSRSCSGR